MKVAYFGCDLFMQCLDVFRSHGHDIVAIFAAESANNTNQLASFTSDTDSQFITGKPDEQHIEQLEDIGVDCFLRRYYSTVPFSTRYYRRSGIIIGQNLLVATSQILKHSKSCQLKRLTGEGALVSVRALGGKQPALLLRWASILLMTGMETPESTRFGTSNFISNQLAQIFPD